MMSHMQFQIFFSPTSCKEKMNNGWQSLFVKTSITNLPSYLRVRPYLRGCLHTTRTHTRACVANKMLKTVSASRLKDKIKMKKKKTKILVRLKTVAYRWRSKKQVRISSTINNISYKSDSNISTISRMTNLFVFYYLIIIWSNDYLTTTRLTAGNTESATRFNWMRLLVLNWHCERHESIFIDRCLITGILEMIGSVGK